MAFRSGSNEGGFSASVRLFLRLNGKQIQVAQVGSDRLYFDEPVQLPQGLAELIVEIDGKTKSISIWLPARSEARIVVYSTV